MPIVDPIEPVSDGMAYTDLETVNVKPWPEPTLLGLVVDSFEGCTYEPLYVLKEKLEALGIVQAFDLPVSVLARRLAAGQRAEEALPITYGEAMRRSPLAHWRSYGDGWDDAVAWIRGEDTP